MVFLLYEMNVRKEIFMKGKTSNLKVWETQLKNYISNELREPLNIEHVQTLNSER